MAGVNEGGWVLFTNANIVADAEYGLHVWSKGPATINAVEAIASYSFSQLGE